MTQTTTTRRLDANLARTGQHAQAIDLSTQALNAPKLKLATQMDLLDLATQDADRMVRPAKAAQQARLDARLRVEH